MSEQWYCPNCGIVNRQDLFVDKPNAELACKGCYYLVSDSPPPYILAMQERIAALEKVAESLENLLCALGDGNMWLYEEKAEEALIEAGYLKENGDER